MILRSRTFVLIVPVIIASLGEWKKRISAAFIKGTPRIQMNGAAHDEELRGLSSCFTPQ
jgi:hypothetical protein